MDMLASIFAANYAFYANIQGRRPMFYPTPVACHPPHVSQFLPAQLSSSSSSSTLSRMTTFSSPFLKEEDKKPETRTDGTEKKDNNVKFSIDNILNEKYSSSSNVDDLIDESQDESVSQSQEDDIHEEDEQCGQFSWLQCTRYKPPKLPRLKKKDGTRKRKLGRNPRVPFTQHQVSALEQKFRQTHYLSSMDVAELSTALSLTETRVKIWFQNRRARERRDREASQRGQVLHHKHPHASGIAVPISGGTPWTFPLQSNSPVLAQYRGMVQLNSSAFTPVSASHSSC